MRNTRQALGLIALSPLALALSVASVHAANRVDLHGKDVAQLNRQYQASGLGVAAAASDRHAELLGLDPDSSLKLLRSRQDQDGSRVHRYEQNFRGIPVFGEHVIVREDSNGNVSKLFGRMVTGLASEVPATAARIPGTQALTIAKRAALGSGLSSKVVERESTRQMIYVGDGGRARMSYVVSFFADAPKGGAPTRPFVIVDAQNGAILKQWDGLAHAEIGTGPGGNQKTGQYEYGTDFGFMDVTQSGSNCTMNNANVKTVDLNHGTSGSTAYSYTCPRNTKKVINGAFSPLNDAHYFGGVVYDMYNDYVGSPPLTFQLTMRVHYSNSYENAFWDGSSMTFGDGASTFYPLVSLDVSAHEVSHGYTEQQSGLIYDNQSGGINEAFSDMAGEAAEYFMQGSNDFLVGADIFKAAGEALRYMANPPQDGASIDHTSDYSDSVDVHYSSGIYNKTFHTLATSPGWNTKTAFQAFARANRDYWTPSTTFNQGAVGVVQAACDLGMSGQDVINAFTPRGVNAGSLPSGCGGGGNQAPTAGFSSSISGLTVNFTDSSTDSDGSIASRSWNFGDGSSSTQTNPSHAYAAGGTYSVTLTVTDDDGATDTETKSVTVDGGGGGGTLQDGVPVTGIAGASGNQQFWTMVVPAGASNLTFTTSGGSGDADLYVKFGSAPTTSSYDCRPYRNGNAETCTFAAPQAGTYHVMLRGYTAYSGVTLVGNYDTGGGGTQTYTNGTDYPVNDNATVDSPITVSGRSGNAPSNASIVVDVRHTYKGDLKVDLVAPDGSLYNIHNRSGGSADNVQGTFTKNLSTEPLNGTWKLRVNDNASLDTGYINSWSVTF